ncbi:hypothetical protein BJX70DRAFT_397222 [Aspergillus crustosus]
MNDTSPQYPRLSPGDRALLVPRHVGENVLPNLPFFEKLLRFAHRDPPRVAVRDMNLGLGMEKTYLQLLNDAIALRRALKETLSPVMLKKLDDDQEVFIALIAPGGYEYAVGFVAILALGAAVVPISPALPPTEAQSLIHRAQCVSILSSTTTTALANTILTTLPSPVSHIQIHAHIYPNTNTHIPLPASKLHISSSPVPNMNTASLIIYTSGTTGPPKAAIQRRSYIASAAEDIADQYRLTEDDTVLHTLPVHHATGIGITFLPFLVSGACVEFRNGRAGAGAGAGSGSGFDPAWTWDRFRKGGITVFSGVPTMYIRLMRYFESHLAISPDSTAPTTPPQKQRECESYIAGARRIRVFLCGTSALPAPVQEFWMRILDGRQILTRFGGTEFHAVIKAGLAGETPVGSVGSVSPGVDVKLGKDGMILVRGPNLFSRYLNDIPGTKASHDSEGYFITGDIARCDPPSSSSSSDTTSSSPNYYILGRASIDIIKSGGYKISALDIEREILGLGYVSEGMVVGVDDEEFGQRVGAVVVLKEGYFGSDAQDETRGGAEVEVDDNPGEEVKRPLTIEKLRNDLRRKLAGYKLPTLLRVVEGEIPKTATGKVQKKVLGPRYFPKGYREGDSEVQVWKMKGKGAKL